MMKFDTRRTRKMTINQILNRIDQIPIDSMTEELGEERQKLINLRKKNSGAGDLVLVDNTKAILKLVNKHQYA